MSSHNFCNICQNLLTIKTNDNVLKFECAVCRTEYPSEPSDTLRYEHTTESDIIIFNRVLNKIADDPVNPKYRRKCPKCKKDIVRQIRLGDNMRAFCMCLACRYRFVMA